MTDQTQALTTTEARTRAPMMTGGAVGALVPQTLEEAFRLASAMAASGMTPRDIDTTEKVLVAIMAGAELGMKPFQAVQSFAIVNGRPSLWGDGLMALALTNGLDVDEWIQGEGDARTAYCRVTRPDNGKVVVRDYSVEKAKTAKLWGKVSKSGNPSPWVTSPDRMLQMRARSYAIRDAAADVLRGMPIKEEVEDFIEANPGITDRQDEPKGTGLLAKLEGAQTLTGAAAEGFGIRNLADEAGDAAPAAEPAPKPKRRTNKAIADEALAAIAEAEPEIVAQVVEDHGDEAFEIAPDSRRSPTVGEVVQHVVEAATAIVAADPENLPADAQVEETAPTTPEPTQTAPTAIDGPAPAGVRYFLADKEAFPSGRRVVYVDGQSEKEAIDDTPDVPTYTAHAQPAPVDAAFDDAPAAPEPLTAFDTFNAALETATDVEGLTAALRALFGSGECATPDDKRGPRMKVWARVRVLNEGGAKIAPEADPFVLGCYLEAETDAEAVQAVLPLARDQSWFAEGGERMQAGVARAVMDRVKALQGAG
jgi:hypothetical protein